MRLANESGPKYELIISNLRKVVTRVQIGEDADQADSNPKVELSSPYVRVLRDEVCL